MLWLLRASRAELASMHIADLCGPQYSTHGLDLQELRAVWAVAREASFGTSSGILSLCQWAVSVAVLCSA